MIKELGIFIKLLLKHHRLQHLTLTSEIRPDGKRVIKVYRKGKEVELGTYKSQVLETAPDHLISFTVDEKTGEWIDLSRGSNAKVWRGHIASAHIHDHSLTVEEMQEIINHSINNEQ